MGCCQSKQDVSETQKNRPDSKTRAKIYLAPSAQDEKEKEQEAMDPSPAWLEQLAINLPEVDEQDQGFQCQKYLSSPRTPEAKRAQLTDIFQFVDLLKPVSKEDYEGKWFSRLLTDHTFEVKFDKRLVLGFEQIHWQLVTFGLQGRIPDRAQVAIICHHYYPSVFTIFTFRVRNNRLWKWARHQFGSFLWRENYDHYEFNDYLVLSYQLPSFPEVGPSSTLGQVEKHIKKNWESRKWYIIRRFSRHRKFFSVWKVQGNTNLIRWEIEGNDFSLSTEVHYFIYQQGSQFYQFSVFWMNDGRFQELGGIFEW